eukprot:scaffold324665_cov58-Tisochrysis_lutea.AAC.1
MGTTRDRRLAARAGAGALHRSAVVSCRWPVAETDPPYDAANANSEGPPKDGSTAFSGVANCAIRGVRALSEDKGSVRGAASVCRMPLA